MHIPTALSSFFVPMKGQPRTARAHPSRGRFGHQRPLLPLANRVRLFAAQPTSPGGGAGARGQPEGLGVQAPAGNGGGLHSAAGPGSP